MISGAFGTLAFLNPWILAALATLPVLWFLLRVTPPAPRLIVFPAARFLAALDNAEQTPSKTPWWILLLRLLAVALIILALSRPILNPGDTLPGQGGLRIVVDNGWAAGQTWTMQMDTAADLLERAGRERREIYIATTAPEPGKKEPAQYGPLSSGAAESVLRGLRPLPWPADYNEAAAVITKTKVETNIHSIWLAHGLKDSNPEKLFQALQAQGSLAFMEPEKSQLPVILRPDHSAAASFGVLVSATPTIAPGVPVTIHASGNDGRMIDSRDVLINPDKLPIKVAFELPLNLQNQITRVHINGRSSAGSVVLTDENSLRRTVGIAAPSGEAESAPLTEASFYIRRALEPYAEIADGSILDLIEKDPSAIILPDIGAMTPEELNALEEWVIKGGLLLRFGGPNMTSNENFLIPVNLRRGGRALDGSLTWDSPVKLAAFPESSPYYGLNVPEDITVTRQLLADPDPELAQKSWAALEDGTPLITAERRDNGLVVLIHTTATPEWSNFALSGLFVQILKRTIQMAGSKPGNDAADASGTLQPITVLDGKGQPVPPSGSVQPIPAGLFDTIVPDSAHPPGIYGRSGFQRALNLGERLKAPEAFETIPSGITRQTYGKVTERDLMPYILCLALLLFFIDWVVMILLQSGWKKLSLVPARAAAASLILIVTALPSHAASPQDDMRMAGDIHLAYIATGVSEVDSIVSAGLDVLRQTLTQRTSIEPASVVAINPETDEMAFFPLIYWAVTADQKALSDKALRNIQYYLDHGGTILIDTRDHISVPRGFGETAGGSNAGNLRRLLGSLDIPPLVVMPKDHVLTKSFYLMTSLPGRYDGRTIWVEENSASGRDGVSSVIIGGNDWASAWASAASGNNRSAGGPQQQEMALRFGVNLMMYALTGNYKADQVHLPHILERLGQ